MEEDEKKKLEKKLMGTLIIAGILLCFTFMLATNNIMVGRECNSIVEDYNELVDGSALEICQEALAQEQGIEVEDENNDTFQLI